MLDSIGNDKNIMAISHPPCSHVWLTVKCSMGGPPEARAVYTAGWCFAIHLLGGNSPPLTTNRMPCLYCLRLMILIPLDYLRVNPPLLDTMVLEVYDRRREILNRLLRMEVSRLQTFL